MTPGEVEALRQTTDEFVDQSRTATESDTVFDLEPGHAPDNPKLRRLKSPVAQHEIYRSTLHHERILDIVGQLIGPRIRTNGDKLNMKSGEFGSPVEWHQDWAFYPHTNDDLLAVGVCIDDMNETNGCLLVIPGSHKGPIYNHHLDGHFAGAVTTADFDDSAAEKIELAAGGISIHHVRALHGFPAQHLAPSAPAPTLAVLRWRLLALGASARLGGLLPDLRARRAEPAHPRRRRAREHADARSQSRRLHLRYPDRIAPLDLRIGESRAAHLILRITLRP